jgi:hypothetical protein
MGKETLLLCAALIAVAASTCAAQQWTTFNPTVIGTGSIYWPNQATIGTWEVYAGYNNIVWLWEVGNYVTKLTPCGNVPGGYNWIRYQYLDTANPLNSQWWVPLLSGRACLSADPLIARTTWMAFTAEAQLVGPSNTGSWISTENPTWVQYKYLVNPSGTGDVALANNAIDILFASCSPVLGSGSAVQQQVVQVYTCSKCGQRFTDLNAYRQHIAEC